MSTFRNQDHATNTWALLSPLVLGGALVVGTYFLASPGSTFKFVMIVVGYLIQLLGAVLAIRSLRNITRARNAYLGAQNEHTLVQMIGSQQDHDIDTGAILATLDHRFPNWRNHHMSPAQPGTP